MKGTEVISRRHGINATKRCLVSALCIFTILALGMHMMLWTQNGRSFSLREVRWYNSISQGGEIDNPHTRTKRSLSSGGKGVNQTEKVPFSNRSTELNETLCTPPSIQEFPRDLFTDAQRENGAVIIHILVSIYIFIALAFVCDDYFVASLDHICENLNLTDDVAGATFMAIGGSAPELFTSIIGLFIIGYGDVGPGTIVGSAVFNILVALALVSLFAGQTTKLSYWPMCRDSFSYSVAVAALIGVMYDSHISWYESVIMLLLYVCYCILMRFNAKLQQRIEPESSRLDGETDRESLTPQKDGSEDIENGFIPSYCGKPETYPLVTKSVRKLTWREVGMMVMLSNKFHPKTRFKAACYMVTMRLNKDANDPYPTQNINGDEENRGNNISINKFQSEVDPVDIKIEAGPFYSQDQSLLGRIFWIISRPIALALHCTIPDCKAENYVFFILLFKTIGNGTVKFALETLRPALDLWANWYMVTFVMSILWIGVLSYIMVWMVVVIGYTFGIPDVIMGITFLAAGSSIPDALASLIVARQGQGNMAVANSLGSNVFDILIGLALPWFFQTCILHPGSVVEVNSRGLIYSVILLFATVFVTIFSIHMNKWQLDKKTGLTFIISYLIFITLSSLIEFNVFGFVNLPTCSL